MSQLPSQREILDYQHPATPRSRPSGFAVASIVFTGLTAYPTYIACEAVYYSHRMPGHYFPLMIFSFAFWLVLLGGGIGISFAVASLRQKHRSRRLAILALAVNVLYLAVLLVMFLLTNGGTESA